METSGTSVEQLSRALRVDRASSYIELRGNLLVLNRTGKRWFTTAIFDTTGATVEMKNFPPWYPHRLTLLVTFIALPFLYAIANALTGRSYDWIVLLVLAILSGTMLARIRWHKGRIPAAILRLNTCDSVFELPIRYAPGTNEALDNIVAHFRPFEERYHQFESRQSAFLATHWSDSGAMQQMIVSALLVLQGAGCMLKLQMMRLRGDHAVQSALDNMFILVSLLTLAFGAVASWRHYRQRLPKPIARIRESAHQAFASGDYATATDILRAIDLDSPHGDITRLTLADIAVVSGNNATARTYLNAVSSKFRKLRSDIRNAQETVTHLESLSEK